jgi:hypothetical protein
MSATVSATVNFKGGLLSQLLSQPLFEGVYRKVLVLASRKEKMKQAIDNIGFVTVKLLSHAKSLKSLDATVNPP